MSDSHTDDAHADRPAQPDAGDDIPLVLIAEDERPIAEALGDVVEDAGCRVVCARDGRSALELARQQRPALIITDYMMPYMNGAELIAALRDDARSRGLQPPPVALMSAAGRHYLDGAGADAVIAKPFDVAEIESILRRFIGAPRQADG